MSDSTLFEQLLEDRQFLEWVQSGSKKEDVYWLQLLAQYPEQRGVLNEAKRVLEILTRRHHIMSVAKNEELRQRVLQTARRPDLDQAESILSSSTRPKFLWLRAAVVLLVVGLGGWVFWWFTSTNYVTTYRTAYGEIKEIWLPDSSFVTLNANSSLEYRFDADQRQREVWLSGEAFFDVRKKELQSDNTFSNSVSFLVHADDVSVQVLGTRFNIKHRREQTQVVLEEGSIRLRMDELDETLLMQPDELIEVQQGSGEINQHLVEAQDFSVWKEGLLRFERASFDEISRVLTDNYGIKLRFADSKVSKQIQLRGVFPAENVDLLLEAIANVTSTSMSRKGELVEYE